MAGHGSSMAAAGQEEGASLLSRGGHPLTLEHKQWQAAGRRQQAGRQGRVAGHVCWAVVAQEQRAEKGMCDAGGQAWHGRWWTWHGEAGMGVAEAGRQGGKEGVCIIISSEAVVAEAGMVCWQAGCFLLSKFYHPSRQA